MYHMYGDGWLSPSVNGRPLLYMIVCIFVVPKLEISELNTGQKKQEEMASPPIGVLIGKIVSFVESKVSLLGGVHDELEDVRLELLTMKAFLADAEGKGEALSEVEKTWVANVRYVSLDVEDILDEFTYRINKQTSWSPFKRAFCQTVCFPKNLGRGIGLPPN